jgi:hypothetical protein
MSGLPRYRVRLLHLTAVWAYGVSQPVLALIGGNLDLLIERDVNRASAAAFAILLVVLPPALMIGYAWLAARFSAWIGDVLYLVWLGACLVPLAARLVKLLDAQLVVSLSLVALASVAGVVVYRRSRATRMFVGYSIVLPLVSLASFVHGLPDLSASAEASGAHVTTPVPIVFLQLDEMSGSALMTPDGKLDAARYPNFARLARDGVWYRNATTVHEWTSDAVPSILSGQVGTTSGLPTLERHPQNLFTLLGGDYKLHVAETITRLCPRTYCPRDPSSPLTSGYGLFEDSLQLLVTRVFPSSVAGRVVKVSQDLEEPNGPAAIAQLDSLVRATTREKSDDVLLFDHLLLPHAPWRYFPSGVEYDRRQIDGWSPTEHWGDDAWLTLQGYQRFLLQVGYVDNVLGDVLRQLDRAGLYDRAMIVVLADHGVSFRPGQGRRPLTGHNLADIVNMPLFVKYPHGLRRGVDSRPVRTVDVLPTIADVLGIRIPWRVDGLSLLGPIPADRGVMVDRRGGKPPLRVPLADVLRDRLVTLRFQARQFGEGHDSLFRIGTHKRQLGRDVAGVEARSADVTVGIENRGAFLDVRPGAGMSPARISGTVSSGRLDAGVELAVAVNGRVRALTSWFRDADGEQRFRALVPESSFHAGRNSVDVYAVGGSLTSPSLVRVGSSSEAAQR